MPNITRKQFLKGALAMTASVSLSRSLFANLPAIRSSKRILVLGGTRFLGPAIVRAASECGHVVTLFNRGVTNPDFFPYLEKLHGYRSTERDEQNFVALGHRHWDVVIDVWPNNPTVVETAADYLKDKTEQYLFISSIAAYDPSNFRTPNTNETASTAPWDGSAGVYARGKAESERRLTTLFGERLTVVRPGPIKGMRDTSPDLWTWLYRAQSGGSHVAPGNGRENVQVVDVADVARFSMLAIERKFTGVYNLTGRAMSFRNFVERCRTVVRSSAEFAWVGTDFLDERKMVSEAIFPFWRPRADTHEIFNCSCEKALAAGWQPRPFEETALDCLDWNRSLDPSIFEWTDPLGKDVEAQLLSEWAHRPH